MEIDPFWLLAAAGGGFIGAAIGALQAFIFTGFMVVLGIIGLFADPDTTFMSFVAFGPVFGPHIAFAAGAAAAAYAGRRGYTEGKDIITPLVKFTKPDVLLVGALFGMLGYLINAAVSTIPWFGTNTDSIALTVVISALIARFTFGRTGLTGVLPPGSGGKRYAPTDGNRWIELQERFMPNTVLGFFAGIVAAGTTLMLAENFPQAAGYAHTFVFGISAISLVFLAIGMPFPVTHHITLVSGVAAHTFVPLVNGSLAFALIIGAVFGMVAAWAAELFARFWHDHGDTHVDPPASAIWPMTTLALALGAALS